MTGKQKRYLRALASTMPAVVMIGKGGLENPVIDSARAAITKRELIKVSLLQNTMEEPQEAAEVLAEQTGSTIIQVIGHTIVLYKQARNPKNRDISIRFAEFVKRGR